MVKTVGIVSLSSGILGEDLVKHELEIGVKRLLAMGLTVRFMPHALKGLGYVRDHPQMRAQDLLTAFKDPEIDMILCAIGGDDTYRLLPYLFDHGELQDAVNDKIFLGFSDTTVNHFMLHKLGAVSYYGQSFLSDVCELGPDMLPYSRTYFEELVKTGGIREIRPADLWYSERTSFAPDQIGVPPKAHKNVGFELLQGPPVFSGKILGGCIDSIYDFFNGDRYADIPEMCRRYGLFPSPEDWKGRILLLESSEEKPSPEKYRTALRFLKAAGVFDAVSGVLVGKPMDEAFAGDYKASLAREIGDPDLPVLFNVNIGHANPRCIMPFGIDATVDANSRVIRFHGRQPQIRRITHYERALRTARSIMDLASRSHEDTVRLKEKIRLLSDYYASDDWKQDFADDEAGLLPKDLRRGVLSEDGIDHILERYKELGHRDI